MSGDRGDRADLSTDWRPARRFAAGFLGPLAAGLGGIGVRAAGDLAAEPDQRVVLAAGHALLHRDQRVVGDLDVLRGRTSVQHLVMLP